MPAGGSAASRSADGSASPTVRLEVSTLTHLPFSRATRFCPPRRNRPLALCPDRNLRVTPCEMYLDDRVTSEPGLELFAANALGLEPPTPFVQWQLLGED